MIKMMYCRFLLFIVFAGCFSCEAGLVNESARDIPVIEYVDVLVVGGDSGAVAAAAKASAGGAKVFLAAQRPYLGADICRSRNLWLGQQSPLTDWSKQIFESGSLSAKGIKFKYSASIEADTRHCDTPTPSLLNDGLFGEAAKDSIQYNQHVSINIDLVDIQQVKGVSLLAYQRLDDFIVADYKLSSSIDGKRWTPQATVVNQRLKADTDRVQMQISKTFDARFLKVAIHKGEGIRRILVGELVVETEESAKGSLGKPLRPFGVKYGLDKLLLENGVDFLYGCYPTEILKDSNGKLCGVVFANRAGRQAIVADTIIDASDASIVARLAGAQITAFTPGKKRFERIVIGGKYINTGLDYDVFDEMVEQKYRAVKYGLDIDVLEDTFSQYCRAEQIARELTFSPEQVDASDCLIYSPCRKVITSGSDGKVKGIDNLFILGVEPEDVVRTFELAEKLGENIGDKAKGRGKNIDVSQLNVSNGRKIDSTTKLIEADTVEFLNGPRSFAQKFETVASKGLNLETIEGYDVVVIGGGTSGTAAAIAASRQGAKTLVVEYLDGLGGIGTSGLIGRYCIGIREGFTEQIDRGMADLGGYEYVVDNEGLGTPWDIEIKKEWYRRELSKSGCDIWFGSLGCGALVEAGVVKGAVVATPYGRVIVTAGVVIDSTGNSDIAACAGIDVIYTDADTVEVQGTGLPPKTLGARYTNTDYSFVDDGDIIDIWRMHVSAKEKFKGSYDMAQLIDTRERRRIKGRFVISPVDIYNNRTYPDTIARTYSNFDTHGYTTHKMFNLVTPEHSNFVYANVPYRCMLPVGLEGIIVTGLGISAHRDAVPVLRMQPDVQNHGYAAGLAAAIAVKNSQAPAQIDVRQVQKLMVENGSLPRDVLTEIDSFPLSDKKLLEAVDSVKDNYSGIELLLSNPVRSTSLLKKAYSKTGSKKDKFIYAHILAMLGDDYGIDMLIKKVESADWDKGWNFTTSGQFGSSFSELDNYIIALGFSKSPDVVDVIIAKAQELDSSSDFSHFCALARACDSLADERMAVVIYSLLKKDGMSGYALNDKSKLDEFNAKYAGSKKIRNLNLREILLARSLYRCGDYNGLGQKILKDYSNDLRGHYARCASAVLNE